MSPSNAIEQEGGAMNFISFPPGKSHVILDARKVAKVPTKGTSAKQKIPRVATEVDS